MCRESCCCRQILWLPRIADMCARFVLTRCVHARAQPDFAELLADISELLADVTELQVRGFSSGRHFAGRACVRCARKAV